MGCGSSKNAVQVAEGAQIASANMKESAEMDVAAGTGEHADAAAKVTPGAADTPTDTALSAVQELPSTRSAEAEAQEQSGSQQASVVDTAKPVDVLPGAPEEKAKVETRQTDEERSNNTTPYASETEAKGLGETSPRTDESNKEGGEIPNVAVPLPTPTDVDSIQLPSADPNDTPYWERKDPLPARPGTATRRPGSSAGKIVVYKTEKTKKMEEEARKKRSEMGELPPIPATRNRAPSALPPLKERKKKKKAVDTTVVESPARPTTAEWKGSNGGEAWALDESQFTTPVVADGEAKAPEVATISE